MSNSRQERALRSSAKSAGITVLIVALLITAMGHLLGSCATSDTSANANQSMPSSARGKRVATIVSNGCKSDDGGLCALSIASLKLQLDKSVSEAGFFSAVTNEKPDFKLTVVITKMETDDGILGWGPDTYEAEAKFELADNTGKVVFSGKGSGDSGKAEEAMKKLAADVAGKMKQ
jgi:hypothetical protein